MRHVRALNQELAIHLDILQGCLGIDPVELRKDAFDLIHVDESVFVAVFAVHLCRDPGTEARDRDGVENEASVFLYLVILVPWNMLKGIFPLERKLVTGLYRNLPVNISGFKLFDHQNFFLLPCEHGSRDCCDYQKNRNQDF